MHLKKPWDQTLRRGALDDTLISLIYVLGITIFGRVRARYSISEGDLAPSLTGCKEALV